MKKLILLMLIWVNLALLAGCDNQSLERNPEPDTFTPNGVEIKTNGYKTANLDFIDTWYTDLQLCISLEAPPPLIVIDEDLFNHCNPENPEAEAVTCIHKIIPYIVLKPIQAFSSLAYKHEFIHYILEWNSIDIDLNHESAIWQCQWN